ncbi:MFS transporter [Knoellia aerolata DSM 18566]|uniref:MFS transporter n=1 Tax=Knoellia aerolata DSM 18566 TaxID=1385519 RepID=A0A0A0JMK4_9MICO|nr:MFS transporter [Knoellia aerolata DSM 18566]
MDPHHGPLPAVGWRFLLLYALAYMSTSLLFLAPLLVSLALKVNSLVGLDEAPDSLALVAGVGAAIAVVANPFFGTLSDRTTSRIGRRRPWIVGGLLVGSAGVVAVALASSIPVVLLGWCVAQLGFNALLAAMAAVLPDRVPVSQRGVVSGVLGMCLPVASVTGTFLVRLFNGDMLGMFLAPCVVGGFFILLFAASLPDRRLDPADRPAWSVRQLVMTFWVSPRRSPEFAWVFVSRFAFVLAFAFLTTYQAYYLLDHVGSREAAVPHQIFIGTLVQSGVLVAASLSAGKLSDRSGRRKVFVVTASGIYALALFLLAAASSYNGYLVGMAVGGLGFGMYMAVDLALAVDVLPDPHTAAKDLGVLNIAGALPSAVAPAIAPSVLALSDGSYAVLYAVAGVSAVGAALAILPVRRVR